MALGRVSVYYNDGKWTICLFLVILQTLILCNLLILLSVFLPRQSAECKLRLEKCFKTFYLFYALYGCPKSNSEPLSRAQLHSPDANHRVSFIFDLKFTGTRNKPLLFKNHQFCPLNWGTLKRLSNKLIWKNYRNIRKILSILRIRSSIPPY